MHAEHAFSEREETFERGTDHSHVPGLRGHVHRPLVFLKRSSADARSVAQHVDGLGLVRGVKNWAVLYLLTLEEFRNLARQLSARTSDPAAHRNTTGTLSWAASLGPPC